ncbi:MAG: type III secretion system cytoplasmic ring protein SctQ [Rubrivivax sp.]|nr:type III secretion system cytoplasmic ring protein SctQ [Rubrivivax sp.]
MSAVDSPTRNEAAPVRASRARLFAALPRLNGTVVALRNRLYSKPPLVLPQGRTLVWQDVGPLATVGELRCSVAAQALPDAPAGRGATTLALAADHLSHLEPRLEGFEAFIPAETCALLVENALSPVLSLLERLLGVPLQGGEFLRHPLAIDTSVALQEITLGFAIFEEPSTPALRGWVRTTAAVWQQMDTERALPAATRRMQDIPLRFSLRVGTARLRLAELRALRSGDALRITPAPYRHQEHLNVTLCAGRRPLISARIAGDTLTLEHFVNTSAEHRNADDDTDNRTDNPTGDLADDIECDVSFELGSLTMKVSELGRLRAGQTLRLGVRLQEQPVRVLVNGRWVARGELAALGDELVVVVTDTSRLPHL